MDETAAGGLGKRIIAWVILVAVAIIALKLAVGVFFGLLQALIAIAVMIAVVMGVLWALRHL